MKDIMLDLETFGNNKDAVIVQIGACHFDRKTGKIGREFLVNVDADSCLRHGLQMTGSTIYWWLSQDQSARTSLLDKRITLEAALKKFNLFARGAKYIWCHATFDLPILMNAYVRVGIEPVFHYRSGRDIRTIMDIAKMAPPKVFYGTKHNGLDDAIFQAGYVVKALQKVASA